MAEEVVSYTRLNLFDLNVSKHIQQIHEGI